MGPRSDFSKPRQGAAEKSANATRRCCLVRGSQPVGISTEETFVFAASFCTMRRFLCLKNFGRPCRAPNPEVGCEPGGVIHVLFENPSVSRFFLCILQSSAGKCIAFNGGAFMLHLSSWMTTLPMMLIGMTGILLVIGFFHRRRRRCFCRIHPWASCRVVWKYSLGVMPYSFLKARKKWL